MNRQRARPVARLRNNLYPSTKIPGRPLEGFGNAGRSDLDGLRERQKYDVFADLAGHDLQGTDHQRVRNAEIAPRGATFVPLTCTAASCAGHSTHPHPGGIRLCHLAEDRLETRRATQLDGHDAGRQARHRLCADGLGGVEIFYGAADR